VKFVRLTAGLLVLGPVVMIVGLLVRFLSGPADCQEAARPIILALERFHRVHGRYPDALEALTREKFLRRIPETTWNLGVMHFDDFQYWVDPDLDYYCLAYTEADVFGGIGPSHWDDIFYVSFRGAWDDAPGVPPCDLFTLPVERAGERFRASRSSASLRLLVKKLAEYTGDGGRLPCCLFLEDLRAAAGPLSPCTIDGTPGLCVQAVDAEAATFGFLTAVTKTPLRGVMEEVVLIAGLEPKSNPVRWRTVFRKDLAP